MPFQQRPDEQEDILVEELVETEKTARLIVFNDDVNTFDWVIECFVEVCGHTPEQAEQLALIIHFKGKATVKTASKEELMPMKDALLERGLWAIIEEEDA
jgi:ATP-dependent Clp protease adaptor protein ClpS